VSDKSSALREAYHLVRDGISAFFDPVAEALTRFGVSPNVITSIGFLVSAVSGYFFATGMHRLGGVFILLAGIFDILDGKIARGSNRVTRFGALYDSTLDRYGEIFVFLGIAYYFIGHGHFSGAVAACIALGGSLMVSYVRARAEGLGLTCKVGFMQRPERILTIGFTALVHPWAMIAGMYFLAVFANFTAVQRLYHVWATENGKKHEVVPEYDKLG
jgi:CDP-diacylglycerol--glycerol-3-phosphate 3-phosphatidyltransferase